MNLKRMLVLAISLGVFLGLAASNFGQTASGSLVEANALKKKAEELYQAGRYQEALPLYEQA